MVDYKHKDLFLRDSFHQDISIKSTDGKIKITNTELHFEQFELFESLCSESTLKFGRCEASVLKFRISNVVGSLIGKELVVSSHINGADDYFAYGTYKVASDKPTADKKSRDVVAYDRMYDIINSDVAEWYNSLIFPMSLKAFRNLFLEHFGIQQEGVVLPNDSMNVEKTISPSSLSGEAVITAICEINGCFGHIGRDGKFRYIFLKEMVEGLYPSNTLFPRDNLFPADAINAYEVKKSFYIGAEYEDFSTERINKLQIRKEENDIGVTYGSGNNCYVVEDNFLLYGKSTEELQGIAYNMYSAIKGIWYRPTRVDAKGNPCFEVGDGIKLHTSYAVVYTYILQRTLKGIQALRDSYVADGEEKQPTNSNSYHKEIIQLKGKTNILSRTIEETRLEMTDIEKDLSTKITANAESVRIEAERAKGKENELSASIEVIAGEVALKVEKGNIINEINLSTESAVIKAPKIDLVGLVEADEFVSKYATITRLESDIAEVEKLFVDYAKVSELEALTIRVNSIDADYASFKDLEVQRLRVDTLDATVGAIQTDYVSTNQLNAVTAKVNVIEADYVSAKTLGDDVVTAINGKSVYLNAIQANGIINANGGLTINGYDVTRKTATIGGVTINYWGWD